MDNKHFLCEKHDFGSTLHSYCPFCKNDQLRAENVMLRYALTVSRGQWIHSANKDQCLEALNTTPQTKLLADLMETAIKVDRVHGWHCNCEHCEKHSEAVLAYKEGVK